MREQLEAVRDGRTAAASAAAAVSASAAAATALAAGRSRALSVSEEARGHVRAEECHVGIGELAAAHLVEEVDEARIGLPEDLGEHDAALHDARPRGRLEEEARLGAALAHGRQLEEVAAAGWCVRRGHSRVGRR